LDGITITLPEIMDASITPNPVNTEASFLIAVTVTEITKTLYPEPIYAGECYAGEY
jgi:hypothetical protein